MTIDEPAAVPAVEPPPANESVRPPTAVEDPILNLTEAAKQLGKTRRTIARWVEDGLIKSGRMPGGTPGIRQSQIDKILSEIPF